MKKFIMFFLQYILVRATVELGISSAIIKEIRGKPKNCPLHLLEVFQWREQFKKCH
jgi:hypothetical protein